MRHWLIRGSVIAVSLLVASAAFAQADAKPEFSIGLSLLHEFDNALGVGANVVLPPFKKTEKLAVGVLGGIALNHFEGANEITAAGGVRVTIKTMNPKVEPFIQGRFGIVHCCGFTDKVIGPGGGINFAVSEKTTLYVSYEYFRIFDPATRSELQFGYVFR